MTVPLDEGGRRLREDVKVKKPIRIHQTLPPRVVKILQLLKSEVTQGPGRSEGSELLDIYCAAIHARGWTLQSMADPLGLTREAIRLRCVRGKGESLGHLPVPPPPPTRIVIKKGKQPVLPDEIIAELREMQRQCASLNGAALSTDPRRVVSAELAERLNDLRQEGWPQRYLAQVMGVTAAAVSMRLARYGYKEPMPSVRFGTIKGHATFEKER